MCEAGDTSFQSIIFLVYVKFRGCTVSLIEEENNQENWNASQGNMVNIHNQMCWCKSCPSLKHHITIIENTAKGNQPLLCNMSWHSPYHKQYGEENLCFKHREKLCI